MLTVPKDWGANMALRKRLLWDGAHVPGAAEAIRAECARNILFYVNLFCYTFNPRLKTKVIPFVGYPFQDDALLRLKAAVEDGHNVVVEKSRDLGASWLNIYLADWFFRFVKDASGLLVSRKAEFVDKRGDRKSLFWKLDFTLENSPSWLTPRFDRTAMHIENLDNGATIDGESTTGDVGRGDRRTFVLMDEFASVELDDGFRALASTGSTADCIIFNSTPQGNVNAFAQVAREAKEKGAAEVIRMHWSQHPVKNVGLYTSEKAPKTGRFVLKLLSDFKGKVKVRGLAESETYSKLVDFPEAYPFVLDGKLRSPWYDNECKRGMSPIQIAQELDIDYAGSSYQFFDQAALDRYEALYCRDEELDGEIGYDRETGRPRDFSPVDSGLLKLWTSLERGARVARDRKFVVGADVSAGTGASNSTLAVYDIETCEKAAEYANPKMLPADFAVFAVAVCRFFNNALLVPDRSGPTGEVFVQKVVSLGYSRIFQARDEDKVDRKVVQKYGLWLNPKVKTELLEQYRSAICEAKMINRSAAAIKECRQFVMTMDANVEHSAALASQDPSGARTAHGDIVIADALAWQGLVAKYETPEAEEPEIPAGSLAERMAERRREEAERKAAEAQGEGWGDGSDVGWGDGTEAGW